jgi:hypothetical protein
MDLMATRGLSAVADGIERSPEARYRLVRSWYTSYLGRAIAPSNPEIQGWVGMLLAGATEEQTLAGILASDEFYANSQLQFTGTADARFIQSLYSHLLNRLPTSEELVGWLQALPAMGRQGASLAMQQSFEFRINTIAGYYRRLLHREPDLQGLNTWEATPIDLATVRIGIESSPEFFENG